MAKSWVHKYTVRTLSNRQNQHTRTGTAVLVEAPEAHPPSENPTSEQYYLPVGIAQVGAYIKYLMGQKQWFL